jgi:hypothetical protein
MVSTVHKNVVVRMVDIVDQMMDNVVVLLDGLDSIALTVSQ